jgi:hypothetical protein
MQRQRFFSLRFFAAGFLLLLFLPSGAVAGEAWPPIPPEELTLKDASWDPGAHAVILYRDWFIDQRDSSYTVHYRIKVLTEEGKKYADIEIPYGKELSRISDLKARTVRPDGTSVEFKGEIFERTVVKAKGVKFLARTFSLPDVQVGTIIEYKYKRSWSSDASPEALRVQRTLFGGTQHTLAHSA